MIFDGAQRAAREAVQIAMGMLSGAKNTEERFAKSHRVESVLLISRTLEIT
jgi:hypothetical protein